MASFVDLDGVQVDVPRKPKRIGCYPLKKVEDTRRMAQFALAVVYHKAGLAPRQIAVMLPRPLTQRTIERYLQAYRDNPNIPEVALVENLERLVSSKVCCRSA